MPDVALWIIRASLKATDSKCWFLQQTRIKFRETKSLNLRKRWTDPFNEGIKYHVLVVKDKKTRLHAVHLLFHESLIKSIKKWTQNHSP